MGMTFLQILHEQLRKNKKVLLTSVDLVCVKEHASESKYYIQGIISTHDYGPLTDRNLLVEFDI